MRFLRKFRTQLMILSILLVALAALVTAELTTVRFNDVMWAQNSAAMSKRFELVEGQLLELLDDANHCMSVVRRRDSVLNLFLTKSHDSRGEPTYAVSMLHDVVTVLKELRTISGVLFIHEDRLYGITPDWNFNGAVIPPALRARLDALPNAHTMNWCGAFDLQDFVAEPLKSTSLLSSRYLVGVSRERYSTVSDSLDVTLLTLIKVEDIENILGRISAGTSDVALLDGNGNLLAGADMQLPELDAGADYGETDYSCADGDYRVFYSGISGKNWILARRMDKDAYNRPAAELRGQSYLIGLCAITIMTILYMTLSRLFFRPFQHVMGLFRQVRDGNSDARLEPFDQHILPVADEMLTMRTQLNSMLDSISTLIANTERANRERADMEMRALQHQLNPHMIFNTLTSIRWMIMLQGDNWPGSEKVSSMLVEFAELLQPLFDDLRPEWTLREELGHVKHYMELLRMRYCADFVMHADIPDALYDFKLPRFVLQPLLENSCEHGMAGSQFLRAELNIYEENGFLCISVSDDGCGIAPDRLAALRARLTGSTSPEEKSMGRSGIGLINVHHQLQAHFGSDSGLSVESRPGEGTRVTLRMLQAAGEVAAQFRG